MVISEINNKISGADREETCLEFGQACHAMEPPRCGVAHCPSTMPVTLVGLSRGRQGKACLPQPRLPPASRSGREGPSVVVVPASPHWIGGGCPGSFVGA